MEKYLEREREFIKEICEEKSLENIETTLAELESTLKKASNQLTIEVREDMVKALVGIQSDVKMIKNYFSLFCKN